MGIILGLIYVIWGISALSAFIMSIVCFGYKGSIGDKALGLLLAFVLGPFYWILYAYSPQYCTR